ncbi:MAG: murein biosynthesis integral membrane protein MurJ [Defluviitaleaceae bacterium]|nr:murein biosynthesis integral membrane protein MurJ [Defluviitaleaceae bacterium]
MTSKNLDKNSNKLNKKPMIATVGVMMTITLIGKIMGVLRDRMQGVYFGTYSAEGIAFMQASFLPRVFLDIMFASVFSASFIPVFNRYLETKGKEAAFNLAASFLKIILLVSVTVTVLMILFATPIYSLFLDGESLTPATRELGIILLRIMFPLLILSSLAFSLTGILQSLGQFNIPAAMSVASNGIILLYYLIFIDQFGVYGLATAFLLGWSMQVLIQIPFLIKQNFFRINRQKSKSKDRTALIEIRNLALPVMVASWLGPINFLINTRASVNLYGGEHGLVSLNMAHSLYTVITGLFVLSLANVLFPTLSKLAAREDWNEYTTFLRSSLRGLLFLLLPIAFGLMTVAHPLVRLVFEGGRFQDTSVDITATALFYFSIGIVGFGLHVILSRASFALQDGRGPLVTSIVAIAINFVLSFTLAPILEIGGPALASAIAISVAAMGLFIRLNLRLPENIWTKNMTVDTIKMIILVILMSIIVRFGIGFLGNLLTEDTLLDRVLMIALPAGLGVGIYMTGALFLKIPEARIGLDWMFHIMQRFNICR